MDCAEKERLLVLDTYEDKWLLKWVNGKDDKKKVVREILLQDSMSQVLLAVTCSEDEDIQSFVNEFLLFGDDDVEERMKEVLRKCPNLIQIACHWEYRE